MFLHVSVCPQGGEVVSQHALQVSGGVYPSMPCRSPGGCIPACLAGFQAHTLGGAWGVWQGGSPGAHPLGGSPGPQPGGSPDPQPGGPPGPHPGECVSQHALRQTLPADGYCCGWYAFFWNAFLFVWIIANCNCGTFSRVFQRFNGQRFSLLVNYNNVQRGERRGGR